MKNLIHNLLMGIICIGLLVMMRMTFIFFLFTMLPSMVAFFIDNSRRKYVYKTILACNLAAMLPPFTEFARAKMQPAMFEKALYDPALWLIAYGSAAGGWILIWTCRYVAYQIVESTCENKIHSLEEQKKKMIEEWGDKVKGTPTEEQEAA